MKKDLRTTLLSLALSVGMGVSSGIFVVFANNFISNLFRSRHYLTDQQSHRFILGIVLAYSILFVIVSMAQIFIKISSKFSFIYPVSGGVTLFIACYLRSFEADLGTLECGTRCADTIAPQSAEHTATKLVIYALLALYALCIAIYTAKILKTRRQLPVS